MSSSVSGMGLPPANPPITCTSASIFPKRLMVTSTSWRADSATVRSAGTAAKRGFAKSESRMLFEDPATMAPAARNAWLTEGPRPPLVPVIRTSIVERFHGVPSFGIEYIAAPQIRPLPPSCTKAINREPAGALAARIGSCVLNVARVLTVPTC